MIDWKDVNKELPKEDCKEMLFYVTYPPCNRGRNKDFEEKITDIGEYNSKEEKFINKIFAEYEKKRGFVFGGIFSNAYDKEIYKPIMTHWAYINKPKEQI